MHIKPLMRLYVHRREMMETKRFEGKTAIIVGSGWGIGEGMAKAFACEGANVVCAGRTMKKIERVAAQINDEGGKALPFCVDVSREQEIDALMRFAAESFGGIDILCNNATANHIAPFMDISLEGWNHVWAVTVTAQMLAMQKAAPYMEKSGGGCIINTGSIGAFYADPNFTTYNTCKAAVHTLTKCAAYELAPKKIRVNCVCPGLIVTPAIIAAFPDENGDFDPEYEKRFKVQHPLGELGRPEDIANMAMFLCSDQAKFITGAIYNVDGGSRLTFGKWPVRDSV